MNLGSPSIAYTKYAPVMAGECTQNVKKWDTVAVILEKTRLQPREPNKWLHFRLTFPVRSIGAMRATSNGSKRYLRAIRISPGPIFLRPFRRPSCSSSPE
jgi:hypothetical protein